MPLHSFNVFRLNSNQLRDGNVVHLCAFSDVLLAGKFSIGNAVALICSPEAGWITGQLIDADGRASLMEAHLPLEFQGVITPRRKKAVD
jgi:hypothetical protein